MAEHNHTFKQAWDVGVPIKRLNGYPLDLSTNYKTLDSLKTYAQSDVTAYVGQLVNVVDDNGSLTNAYIIKNKSGELLELASAADVSSLAGVFQFKGVAYSISEDQSVLTCGYAYIATTDGGPSEYKQIVCKSTAYDVAGELYYSWADEDGNILFWTDSTILNSDVSQYDRQEGSFSLYYVTDSQGVKYYVKEQPMTMGDDPDMVDWSQCLQFWSAECSGPADYGNIKAIYCPGGLEALKDGDTFKTVSGIDCTYNEETVTVHIVESVYTFTDKTRPYDIYTSDTGNDKPIQDGLKFVHTVLAAPENAGNVYQIQENEYASNGSIWVKLGSPVEDWIIL